MSSETPVTPDSPPRRRAWRGSCASAALAVIAALATANCGGGKDAADRQIDRLSSEITRIQQDQDRMNERLLELETQKSGKAVAPASSERPPLKVVVLQPEGDAPPVADDEPDPADDGPRETVRASGDGKKAKVDAKTKAQIEKEYQSAIALVKTKQADKAIDALNGFLVRHPDDAHAENAMFWIGAALADKGDDKRAIEQLEGVLARFPDGNKAPDAMLKIALLARKTGDEAKAKDMLAALKTRFPSSDAAKRAPKEP